ncbi:MAG: hypothetical protein HYV67_04685 [Candidatus Taylorbacteria bacterium]|nr:hypothetical protein [Candidatus Taylorbacteria bacterium]
MKTTAVRVSELHPNQMFTSGLTPPGYVCVKLGETYRRFFDSWPLNAIVLPCDNMAGPTLTFFDGQDKVFRIDHPESLAAVMAEVDAERQAPHFAAPCAVSLSAAG